MDPALRLTVRRSQRRLCFLVFFVIVVKLLVVDGLHLWRSLLSLFVDVDIVLILAIRIVFLCGNAFLNLYVDMPLKICDENTDRFWRLTFAVFESFISEGRASKSFA